ncbi:MAG: hypothetical protein U1E68_01705 [Sphingomonadaceae bacterium]|jgi:hypothetical protein
MPSPALAQALDRLDQAIGHVERAIATRATESTAASSAKDDTVRAAIAELDTLIASLGGESNG